MRRAIQILLAVLLSVSQIAPARALCMAKTSHVDAQPCCRHAATVKAPDCCCSADGSESKSVSSADPLRGIDVAQRTSALPAIREDCLAITSNAASIVLPILLPPIVLRT
jgi:hypothetical protein